MNTVNKVLVLAAFVGLFAGLSAGNLMIKVNNVGIVPLYVYREEIDTSAYIPAGGSGQIKGVTSFYAECRRPDGMRGKMGVIWALVSKTTDEYRSPINLRCTPGLEVEEVE
jgi:hypothetical protein